MRAASVSRGSVAASLAVLAGFALSLVYRSSLDTQEVRDVDVSGMHVIRMTVGQGVVGRVDVFGDQAPVGSSIESVAALDAYLSRKMQQDVYVILHYLPSPDGPLCEALNEVLLNRRVSFSVSDDAEGRDIDIPARLTAVAKQLGRYKTPR